MRQPVPTQGMNTRQRQETERTTPLGSPVILAVTTVTNSNSTLWTVTDNKFLLLKRLSACNIAGAGITVTVYLVPDGGAAGNGNKVYDAFAVAANASVNLDAMAGATLKPGDQIIAVTSSATGANFWLDGVEFTGGVFRV